MGNRTGYYSPVRYGYYAFNAANQLTEVYENESQFLYSYDALGNVTEKQTLDGPISYTYDGLGRLSSATANSITTNFTYDGPGRRDSADARKFHYFAKTDLADYKTDPEGHLFSGMTRGPDGLISYTAFFSGVGSDTAWHIYNPHGDTSAITKADASFYSSYRYDAFGNLLYGEDYLDFDYTGRWQRERNHLTGDVRMGVREYDPAQGRFEAVDALKGPMTDPQQRNRYTYTSNNPLTRYDLSGLYWGESYVDAAQGTWNDYREGGFGALWEDWQMGFNSMSTTEQVVLLGVPVVAVGAAVGVEAAGVGGTVIAADALWTGTGALLARAGLKCADKGSKATQVGSSVASRIKFGHGARHLEGTGLAANEVEAAIQEAIVYQQGLATSPIYGDFWGRVIIQGQIIEYRAYQVAGEYVNVGTYYPAK